MLTEKLLHISLLAFPFYIFILSLSCKFSEKVLRLNASVFFIPFTLYGSFFVYGYITFKNIYPDLLLLIVLFFLTFINVNEKNFKSLYSLSILLPIASILIIKNADFVTNLLNPFITVVLAFLIIICLIITAYKNKAPRGILLAALLFMAISIVFYHNIIINSAELYYVTKIASYFLFFIHYNKQFIINTGIRLANYEKQLYSLNNDMRKEVNKRVIEIEKSNRHLLELSRVDPLSRTLNKAAILRVIQDFIESKKTTKFSVILYDIDNFKQINDKYGHIAGDRCIERLGTVSKKSIRDIDFAGRYGGDEFIVVVPGANSLEASYIAKRIVRNLKEVKDEPSYTVSIGIATYPDDASSINDLIKLADKGLYISKGKGKDAISHSRLF